MSRSGPGRTRWFLAVLAGASITLAPQVAASPATAGAADVGRVPAAGAAAPIVITADPRLGRQLVAFGGVRVTANDELDVRGLRRIAGSPACHEFEAGLFRDYWRDVAIVFAGHDPTGCAATERYARAVNTLPGRTGVIVRTPFGTIRAGMRWDAVPAPLRRGARVGVTIAGLTPYSVAAQETCTARPRRKAKPFLTVYVNGSALGTAVQGRISHIEVSPPGTRCVETPPVVRGGISLAPPFRIGPARLDSKVSDVLRLFGNPVYDTVNEQEGGCCVRYLSYKTRTFGFVRGRLVAFFSRDPADLLDQAVRVGSPADVVRTAFGVEMTILGCGGARGFRVAEAPPAAWNVVVEGDRVTTLSVTGRGFAGSC